MDTRTKTVVGIDLSGPSNTADTAAAWFTADEAGLELCGCRQGLDDEALLDLVASAAEPSDLVLGLDAPLSYNPGGGDRPVDRELRKLVIARGLSSGSVMAPTMPRMAYLTLRGVSVARAIERAAPAARIVEVHPGASMVLRGASSDDVRSMKSDATSRRRLVSWLAEQGLQVLPEDESSDHEVAAFACALAAWSWSSGNSVWLMKAGGTLSPYDFAC